MNHTSYTDRSRTYLSQASEELAKADLCQASEKGWGAAAEIVKLWPPRGAGSIMAIGSFIAL